MSRIFDLTETGEPSEATERQVRFLRGFLFDKSCTDQNWHDSMQALLMLFGQQLLKSDDPEQSIGNAIEMLEFMLEKARSES